MAGSKVKIWKQDPSVQSIGIRSSYIPTDVQNGPKDNDIILQGMPHVIGNADKDFIFYPEENPLEFDAVHTFTIVRQVLTTLRRSHCLHGQSGPLLICFALFQFRAC